MKYLLDTVTSKAYWQYVLFSRVGIGSILAIYGFFWLLVESLDFFKIYDSVDLLIETTLNIININ